MKIIEFDIEPNKTMQIRKCIFESLDDKRITGVLETNEMQSKTARDVHTRRYAIYEDTTRFVPGGRVFRVSKPLEPGDSPVNYDVLIMPGIGTVCDCRGYSASGGRCVHVECLRALCGMIPAAPGANGKARKAP